MNKYYFCRILLSIFSYIKKKKYLSLYGIYKTAKLQKSKTGNKNYDLEVENNFADKFKEYISLN